MYWDIDLSKQPLKPKYYLCKPNKQPIAQIPDAFNAKLVIKLKEMNELSFSVPYQVTRNNTIKRNPYIDNIKFKYLIKLVYGEIESYFTIQPPKESDQEAEHMSVECRSLEDELRRRKIRMYKKEATTLRESTTDILNSTNWTIGDFPLEFVGIAAERRSFEMATTSVLSAVKEIADSFDLIIQFDTINKEVNFYKEKDIGKNKGLTISDQKYLHSFLRESDSENFCTRLNVIGKDNLTINRVSLTGESYIEDFSYFLYPFSRDAQRNVLSSSDYMSDELCNAILDYQDLLFNNKGAFDVLSREKGEIESKLIEKQNELSMLENDLEIIEDSIEVIRQYGGNTDAPEAEMKLKLVEIANKNTEIGVVQSQLNAKNLAITTIRTAISKEVNFTPALLGELTEYIYEDDWTDANHYDEKMLYAAGLDEFEKRKFPPMSLSVDIVNFLSVTTEQRNWGKLSLGDTIRFKKEGMGIDLKSNLIEASFDFDSDSISIVVSNLLETNDIEKRIMKRLYKSENAADVLDINKGNWNSIGSDLEKYIDGQIKEAQESMNNLNRDLQRFYADGYITKTESNFLKLSFQETKAEATDLIQVAISLGITDEKTSYEQSLFKLETFISTWIDKTEYPIAILLEDREEFAVKFQNVQREKTILVDMIMKVRDETVLDMSKDYIDIQIIEANATTDELQNQINDFSNDNKITLAEANMLEMSLASAKKESVDIINIASTLGIVQEKTNYSISLTNLETLLISKWINKIAYPLTIVDTDRVTIQLRLEDVQSTKSVLVNKIIEIQAQPGKNADDGTKKSIRNPNPILAPTVMNDGSAIDHVQNKDSSVDISFEWNFTENSDSPISGFGVLVYSSDSSVKHVPSLQTDSIQQVDKKSRSFILTGVTANKYYTFGVVAYRNVDPSINSESIIRSPIATSSLITESPFRPSANISYEGDITGTIGGTPFDRFNRNSETIIIGTEVGINGSPSPQLKSADIIITVDQMALGADIIINQAIQSIKASGGIIRLQEGIYKCAKTIKLPSNIALVGAGKSTVLMQILPSGSPNGILKGLIENENKVSGNINIMIKDITINMSRLTISETSTMRAMLFEMLQEATIFNVGFISSSHDAIYINKCSRIMIINNSFEDVHGSSFYAFRECSDVIFSENTLKNVGHIGSYNVVNIFGNNSGFNIMNNIISDCGAGMGISGSRHIVSGNKINTITSKGIQLNADDTDFSNNVIYDCKGVGLDIRGNRNKITSNRVMSTYFENIVISGKDNSITGNYFSDASTLSTKTYSNITLTASTERNTVANNTCRSIDATSKYGIELLSNARTTLVKDNDLRASGASGAISDAGTGTIKEGNTVV